MNRSALPQIQSNIKMMQHRLKVLSQDASEGPTSWGDIQPQRELLRGQLSELLEKERTILLQQLDNIHTKTMGLHAHRQHGQADQDISLLAAVLILTVFGFGAIAMLLHSFDVLLGQQPGFLGGLITKAVQLMGHLL